MATSPATVANNSSSLHFTSGNLPVAMARTFAAMPPVLTWLTVLGLSALVFPVAFTLLGLRAFGRPVTGLAWWSSGAGPVSTATCLLTAASALLMLRRARYARILYLLSWVALRYRRAACELRCPHRDRHLRGGLVWQLELPALEPLVGEYEADSAPQLP